MPKYDTAPSFDNKLAKHNGGKPLKKEIANSFKKFGQEPVPRSLNFKPIEGCKNVYSIRVLGKFKGWRIMLRKITDGSATHYEAFDFDNHDIRRRGN